MILDINGVKIGKDHPCYIIFEAGPTHQGLESAKRLALNAKESGANAIKFQLMDAHRLVADPKIEFSYEVFEDSKALKRKIITEPVRDILSRRDMKLEEWKKLKEYCDSINIEFFSTACFYEQVDFLIEIGCKSIKIASADINHLPLIKYVAKTKVSIQLDTGLSTLDEIAVAVDTIKKEGNDKIIIHHCPSGYPVKAENVDLLTIKELKKRFNCIVAFSDHSLGWDMDIAAIALGAEILEKTVTEDKTIQHVEHVMSLEPHETRVFVKTIRRLEKAMGSKNKTFTDEEIKKRDIGRRSLHVSRDLPAKHKIKETDIDFRRPGHGISPDRLNDILSKTLKDKKKVGEILKWTDLEI